MRFCFQTLLGRSVPPCMSRFCFQTLLGRSVSPCTSRFCFQTLLGRSVPPCTSRFCLFKGPDTFHPTEIQIGSRREILLYIISQIQNFRKISKFSKNFKI